jgi:predicted heme/steroid binding protein
MNNKNLIYLPIVLGIILVLGLVTFFVIPSNKTKTPPLTQSNTADPSRDKDIFPESKLIPGNSTDAKPTTTESTKELTLAEVGTHNDRNSCYVIYQKNVYDLTNFIGRHEGGDQPILDNCGKTIDSLSQIHPGGSFSSPKVQAAIKSLVIGTVK